METTIGKLKKQEQGFSAFAPSPFPPRDILVPDSQILLKIAEADRLIGKLDGITHTLPDVEFFLRMFVVKDAESSAQIEGTKATIVDALEKEVGIAVEDTDADDILHYIKALNYGTTRLETLPLSLRLIREIHDELMTDARASHFADPGQFRKTQNWIGGTTPADAFYVPPAVPDMHRALDDFEKFLHRENDVLPLIHIALAHAQFETIHPFLDGNGRTGRLLVTILFCHRKLLEKPVLFLSTYFRKHQQQYYRYLNDYHEGQVTGWLEFFLDGVIDTANASIRVSKQIRSIRDVDMEKVQSLGKREAASGIIVLSHLFGTPIVTTSKIMEWTKFTRAGAQGVLDRFVELGILDSRDEKGTYDRRYTYTRYLNAFVNI